MKGNYRPLVILLLIIAALLLAGCEKAPAADASHVEPAIVEPIAGTDYNRIVLTEKAVERLRLQTDVIREQEIGGQAALVAPYAAVIYGLNGETWLYVNDGPLSYHREPIAIDRIEGDLAILSSGPPAGTSVVTVAVAELYGTDTGVGK